MIVTIISTAFAQIWKAGDQPGTISFHDPEPESARSQKMNTAASLCAGTNFGFGCRHYRGRTDLGGAASPYRFCATTTGQPPTPIRLPTSTRSA